MKVTLQTTILLAMLFFGLQMQAQEISLGVKGGFQNANVVTPDFIQDLPLVPEFQAINTANFGLVSEVAFHPNFALQTELVHTTKGTQFNENFDVDLFNVPLPVGVTALSKFNYLEMPVLAKAKFGNENANFYLLAGPTIGYALNGKLQTRAKFLVEVDLFDTPINLDAVNYERLELGGMAGLGFSVNTGNGSQFFVDARYSHGFTQPYDIPVVREKVQHRSIGLNVGFMMPLGGGSKPPRA